MNRIVSTCALVAMTAALAIAEDPKPEEKKPPVEVKLAAKPGAKLRFRHAESTATQVNGTPVRGSDVVHEYTVTVKAARPDGGIDAELRYDSVSGKLLGTRGAADTVFDSAKPIAADADPRTKLLVGIAVAVTKRPIAVTLDARGGVTAVQGLRELWMDAIKGTIAEGKLDPDKDFSDAKCVEEVAPLFAAAPAEAHVPGVAWTADLIQSIQSTDMPFGGKWAISSADAEKVVVAAKLEWKPNPEAVAGGAKAEGTGTLAATYSAKDGFLNSLTKDFKLARDTGAMKAETRSKHTVERL
jgi:hypothetical protein